MKIAVYGTGGGGIDTLEIFEACSNIKKKWDELIFIDDVREECEFRGYRCFSFEEFRERFSVDSTEIVISLGEPKYREILHERITSEGYKLGQIIHEDAMISRRAKITSGAIIHAGVIVSAEAFIKENVYINHRAMIGHGGEIGCNCIIGGNVAISGGVTVDNTSFIGTGACVRDHIFIGEHAIVSMGAVVLRDIPPYKIAVGNPARVVRDNVDERVFCN